MERHARQYKDSAESAQSAASTDLPPVETICKQLDDNLAASSALKVYLRIRPRVGGRPFTDPAFQPLDDKTVESTTATLEHKHQKRFSFTKVFPEGSSQEQLFQEAVQDPVDAFINGANVLLFAYGPTNGGKTYTMQGPPAAPGVVPRTLDRLFRVLGPQVCEGAPVRPDCFDDVVLLNAEEEASALLQKSKLLGEKGARSAADFSTFHLPASESDGSLFLSRSSDYSYDDKAQALLWLSFYEIYNEGIYDLLLPSLEAASKKTGGQRRTILKLGEDRAKRSFVRGLVEVPVHSADEAHRLLCLARNNQSFAETQLNRSSSRSHCVFTVRLVSSTVDSRNGSQNWHVNTLMLCDLAGSERPSKAGTDGSRLREAGRINTSLMVLSRCLESLRNKKDSSKNACVPFRESKLTKVMQAYFTTGGQVSLIVNICPAMSMLEESLNALKFSAVAIEVVPQQLELRHTRCKEAVRRLSERWSRASGGFCASALSPIPAEDVEAGALDADAAEELFETIEAQQRDLDALERELKDTRSQLAWAQKMAAANEAEVNDYKEMVKDLERSLRTQRDRSDQEMAIRVENACEITRLEMYRKAERGSTIELLGRLEDAQCQIADLKKELAEQATVQHDSVAEDCRQGSPSHWQSVRTSIPRSLPIIAPVEIQTEDIDTGDPTAAALQEQALLSKAESELHDLHSRLEETLSLLTSELQARKDAEVAAERAFQQLGDIQQRLSTREVQQEDLERRLEELQRANDNMQRTAAESYCKLEQMRRDMRERELALDVLREQLDNMTEALHEAETKAREEAAHRASAEELSKAAAEEVVEVRRLARNAEESLHEVESRLKAVHEELQICREKLVASEQSRQAAMTSVEAKEEELSRLQQALKSAEEHAEEEAANENRQRRTRRTTRTTRRTTRATRSKAQSLASSELSDGDADFKTPRRTPRRTKKSVAPPDDPLEEEDEHRAVLADDNAEASPLKRLGNFVAGMLSMGTSSGVATSTRNRRQLISTDADFVELHDEQPPSAPRRTTARRKAKQ
ncbi:kinesin-like protein subito [Rhipicephalus sanguineus]|uniref:kinesin-like protein subito n=1 Tax=Rhipicephalus sanguineus TaxID=34632 RepID=UPI0020C4197F|nr:kinesin-like protein subito [Rhipicephalus sanguineus]